MHDGPNPGSTVKEEEPDGDEQKRLVQIFNAISVISTFLSYRQDYLPDADKLVDSVSKQLRRPVTVADLAKIKYLLPRDVALEYQDTPFDALIDEEPHLYLAFYFVEKGNPKNMKKTGPAQITKRQTKFRNAAQAYFKDHSWEDLIKDSEPFVPTRITPPPPAPTIEPKTVVEIVDELKDSSLAHRVVPARNAAYASASEDLGPILDKWGISQLYAHQHLGLEMLREGKHLVITTSTASGKSLIFQIPILKALQEGPNACAMYISPTKALAQDQRRAFQELSDENIGTLDGDTAFEDRQRMARVGRLLFCNPDILHVTVLPQWQRWQRVLENLKYVVIDELHCYSGLFGAHVSMVLRRLRRICFQLGNDTLQFVTCSATIQRPVQFMADMTGIASQDIFLIANDGSPAGAKHYIYQTTPHLVPEDPSSGRVHPISVAAPLLIRLVSAGLRVIAFCKVRRVCELLMRAVQQQIEESDNKGLEGTIMSYRGGYSAEDRRRIERQMFNGELRGIIATSALEIGIDIGNLDAAIVVGFPHSLAAFRQQVGRVGRRSKESLAVYVADGSLLDQSFIVNPDKLFTENNPHIPLPLEHVLIEHHLHCAAYELAMSDEDAEFIPGDWSELSKTLVKDGDLYHCPDIYLPRPADKVSIRKTTEEETLIVDTTNGRNAILESVPFHRVGWTCYEGAVYLHQGKPYLVTKLESDLSCAYVQRTKVTWTTSQRDFTDVDPLRNKESKVIEDMQCCRGNIKVTMVVFGYFKIDRFKKIIEAVDVDLPPMIATVTGMWVNLSLSVFETIDDKNLNIAGAIHAACHLLMMQLPQFVACSSSDIGTECKAPEKELASKYSNRQRPARLIFYEKSGGEAGHGILKQMFDKLKEIVAAASESLDTCECEYGCSNCVALGSCSEHNAILSKPGAQVILRSLAGRPLEGILDGPEPNMPVAKHRTVVPVQSVATLQLKSP